MLIGHQRQIQLLDLHIRAGNMSHAYLFSGPRHVGKMAVAQQMAASMLCEKKDAKRDVLFSCGTCPACCMLVAGTHPDIWTVDREGGKETSLRLEDVQQIRARASLSAYNGTHIFFVRDVSRMTREAANAFLKMLEEPRGQVVFFLLGSNADDVLPTIRSRAWHIKFWPVSEEMLCTGLQKRGVPEKRAAEIARLSYGFPGMAIQWISASDDVFQKALAAHQHIVSLLHASLAERMQYAEKLKDNVNSMNAWYIESMAVSVQSMHVSLQRGAGMAVIAADICRALTERHARFTKIYATKKIIFEDSILHMGI